MRVCRIGKGIVYRSTEGPFRYQAWPTVCRDEKGILYAVFSGMRVGHVCPFGKNLMSVSRDGGKTWSAPAVINDSWLDDRDAGICSMGSGRFVLSYFNHPVQLYRKWRNWIGSFTDAFSYGMTMGTLDTYASYTAEMNHAGSFIRISEDGAQTWGAPIKVPVSSPHGPISAGDGRLLWLGKEMYSGLPEGERESILLMESRDSGKSWSTLSEIAVPEGLSVKNLHEPHLAALPDGGLLGAIRVEGEAEPVEGGTIYLCHSGDGGRTWSVPTATGLRGLPPHLLPRADGSVLCTYARRIPPFGIRAVILRDMGRSIREELVIDEVSELQYAGDLGYPATVELDDGSYVTVYYRIVDGDGKPSIVYTKWKTTEGGKT